MDTRSQDLYPSRLERPTPSFDRLDPVVHSAGADRTHGP